jgi:hypothetical protein
MSSIYIPGHGEMSFDELRIDRALRAYDERLFFARNAETWDWCVFIRMPGDEVMRRVYRADAHRHGWAIYDEVMASQEAYKKKFRDAADEATEESVEVVEHFLRQHGKSPVVKVFMNDVKEVVTGDA